MKYTVVYRLEENRECGTVYYGITDDETAIQRYKTDYPEYINEELARVIKDGVNEDDFERIKNIHYGNFIMNFNDIDSISNSLIGSYFNGEGLFDQLSVLESITIDDVNDRIRTAINIENSSMSVIKQK